MEARVIQTAQELLRSTTSPRILKKTWNLQTDIGMTCGGEVSFLFEVIKSRAWKIAVFGAGHVAQALVPLLATLDCNIECIDPRQEWLDKMPEFPNLRKHLALTPSTLVVELPPDTFIVSITQGHAHDVPILEEALKKEKPFPFVGVIGSKQKGNRIKNELLQKGVATARLESLHCPIGLDIGTNSPVEIAISIAAELLQVRGNIWKAP